ncbi:28S ribosomal protein S18c, mitochondrial [Diaphorina citri]|uniref:28S ribosomal protein S18c, mitochondrial n=1 Tax=Diaphorina citri TaxID=121845 RepID=A0A1S4EJF0_DIACI|nr:28S ribosomal protein S18c, mitochondrial [Diaphorina citri]
MLQMRRIAQYGLRQMTRPVYLSSTRFESKSTNNIYEIDFTLGDPEASNKPAEDLKNPFQKEKVVCILCKMKIKPDYKNIKLLSQFVSAFTGRVYGRHITEVCLGQIILDHGQIQMPYYFKNVEFAHDPELFDPDKPLRNHPY